MSKTSNQIMLPEENVISKIFLIRGKKVMIDRDLAELYGVETRILNQAVRRNIKRFPKDFMFQMSTKELKNWISQFVISNSEKMGLRKPPLVFTEQGVSMLSSVLNSEKAITVNISIIRVFTKMREMLITHKELILEIERVKKTLLNQGQNIELVFQYLDELLEKNENHQPRVSVGYKMPKKK